jgi:hypothetical protein
VLPSISVKANVMVPDGIDAEDVSWGVALTRSSSRAAMPYPLVEAARILTPTGVRSGELSVQEASYLRSTLKRDT